MGHHVYCSINNNGREDNNIVEEEDPSVNKRKNFLLYNHNIIYIRTYAYIKDPESGSGRAPSDSE